MFFLITNTKNIIKTDEVWFAFCQIPVTTDCLVLQTVDPSLAHVNKNCLDLAALNKKNIHWNIGILVGRCSSCILLHLQMPILQCMRRFRFLRSGPDGHQWGDQAISPGDLSHLLCTVHNKTNFNRWCENFSYATKHLCDWLSLGSIAKVTYVKHTFVTQLGCSDCSPEISLIHLWACPQWLYSEIIIHFSCGKWCLWPISVAPLYLHTCTYSLSLSLMFLLFNCHATNAKSLCMWRYLEKNKIPIELNIRFNLDQGVLYSLLVLYTYTNPMCMLEWRSLWGLFQRLVGRFFRKCIGSWRNWALWLKWPRAKAKSCKQILFLAAFEWWQTQSIPSEDARDNLSHGLRGWNRFYVFLFASEVKLLTPPSSVTADRAGPMRPSISPVSAKGSL